MGKNSKNKRVMGRGGDAITFDPEAREEYLRGFSKRKQERRAYGLAMQKVKDRQARLEQRAEIKQALKEQIEQAEQQKEEMLEEFILDHKMNPSAVDNAGDDTSETPLKGNKDDGGEIDKVQMYRDPSTHSQWGGEVIVRTSTRIPGDDDDEDDRKKPLKKRKLDKDQEYAGTVEKYLHTLKAKMPAKKRKDTNRKQKGVHGAVGMKGIASSGGDFKTAQRVLERSQAKAKGMQRHSDGRRKRR